MALRLITDHQQPLLGCYLSIVAVPSSLEITTVVLATEAQLADQRAVALDVLTSEVLEQAATASDHP